LLKDVLIISADNFITNYLINDVSAKRLSVLTGREKKLATKAIASKVLTYAGDRVAVITLHALLSLSLFLQDRKETYSMFIYFNKLSPKVRDCSTN
jgi:hypothetical protein